MHASTRTADHADPRCEVRFPRGQPAYGAPGASGQRWVLHQSRAALDPAICRGVFLRENWRSNNYAAKPAACSSLPSSGCSSMCLWPLLGDSRYSSDCTCSTSTYFQSLDLSLQMLILLGPLQAATPAPCSKTLPCGCVLVRELQCASPAQKTFAASSFHPANSTKLALRDSMLLHCSQAVPAPPSKVFRRRLSELVQ